MIPSSFHKTDDEISRLCDIHLLYVCRDTYAVLKLVFEWKHEVPLGEVSLITPCTSELLEDTLDIQLTKEQNEQNQMEIKQERETLTVPENTDVQDQIGLVYIPALPDPEHSLLDATTNLLVDLPGIEREPMDATRSVPTVDEEGQPMDATAETNVNVEDDEFVLPSQMEAPQNLATSVPCSVVLRDVNSELKGKKSIRIPYTKEEMCRVRVCVKRVDQDDISLPRLRGRKRQKT